MQFVSHPLFCWKTHNVIIQTLSWSNYHSAPCPFHFPNNIHYGHLFRVYSQLLIPFLFPWLDIGLSFSTSVFFFFLSYTVELLYGFCRSKNKKQIKRAYTAGVIKCGFPHLSAFFFIDYSMVVKIAGKTINCRISTND